MLNAERKATHRGSRSAAAKADAGASKASAVANQTLARVKDALGFLPPL